MAAATELLISCEHGGNRVPARYAALFRRANRVLGTHRGWDPGALHLARAMSRRLGAPLIASSTTRLLVDLNRSPHNRSVLSELTRSLDREERRALLAAHHKPHWARLRCAIEAMLARDSRVIHIGVHTFTPVLRGARRRADIGLLYDPQRPLEKSFVRHWRAELESLDPALRVRFNYPYRGTADGVITALRRQYAPRTYVGLEIEVNQRLIDRRSGGFPRALVDAMTSSLATTVAS